MNNKELAALMKLISVVICGITLTACTQAEAPADTPVSEAPQAQTHVTPESKSGLSGFIGTWRSTADAFGQPAKSTMVWSPTLDGKFIRLDYAIDPANEPSAKSIFAGIGYYQVAEGSDLQAFWADTTGDLHPIRATLAENTLTSIWGVEGQKLGKTRYEISESGTMEVTDWIMREDEFKQFNHNVFTKEKTSKH